MRSPPFSHPPPPPFPTRIAAAPDRAALAAQVREELLHAWQGYERYAWGHDELKPVSRTAHDWHRESLLMTPVDALDTLLLVGLTDEAARAKDLVLEKLSFDKDIPVKNFEITIRILGACSPPIRRPAIRACCAWRTTWERGSCRRSPRPPACRTCTST